MEGQRILDSSRNTNTAASSELLEWYWLLLSFVCWCGGVCCCHDARIVAILAQGSTWANIATKHRNPPTRNLRSAVRPLVLVGAGGPMAMCWRTMPNHSNIYQARCVYIMLFISVGSQDIADTSAALLLTTTSFHYPFRWCVPFHFLCG